MDTVLSTVSAPQATPQVQPDVRPTADAAALARDPNPQLAMAIPASMAQSGAVNETRMAEARLALEAEKPTQRVLKPFGIEMLPRTPDDGDVSRLTDASESEDMADEEA